MMVKMFWRKNAKVSNTNGNHKYKGPKYKVQINIKNASQHNAEKHFLFVEEWALSNAMRGD